MNADVDDYRAAIHAAVIAANMLARHDIPQLLAAIEHADTVGPFLDPTLWMKNHKAMDEDRAVLEAALPLWKLAQKLAEKLAEALKMEEG